VRNELCDTLEKGVAGKERVMAERWNSTISSDGELTCSLPVRVRLLLNEIAPPRIRLTVFCPGQRRSVDVESCVSCARNDDPMGIRDRTVRCRPAMPVCVDPTTRAEIESASIGRFMSTEVVCVTPTMSVARLFEHVALRFGGHLPVVAEDGHLVGIVTEHELRPRESWRPGGRALHVGDVMFPELGALSEAATVAEALHKMVSKRARLLPVVDASGAVVGMVSDVAILHAVATLTRRQETTA
jgi:CBS domain-containing protein